MITVQEAPEATVSLRPPAGHLPRLAWVISRGYFTPAVLRPRGGPAGALLRGLGDAYAATAYPLHLAYLIAAHVTGQVASVEPGAVLLLRTVGKQPMRAVLLRFLVTIAVMVPLFATCFLGLLLALVTAGVPSGVAAGSTLAVLVGPLLWSAVSSAAGAATGGRDVQAVHAAAGSAPVYEWHSLAAWPQGRGHGDRLFRAGLAALAPGHSVALSAVSPGLQQRYRRYALENGCRIGFEHGSALLMTRVAETAA